MVTALVSGSSGPGSSPGRGHCVVFLGKKLTLTVPLSTQVYKCVPANLMLGGNPAMDGGSRNTPSRFARETEISSGLMGYLARKQTLPIDITFMPKCATN